MPDSPTSSRLHSGIPLAALFLFVAIAAILSAAIGTAVARHTPDMLPDRILFAGFGLGGLLGAVMTGYNTRRFFVILAGFFAGEFVSVAGVGLMIGSANIRFVMAGCTLLLGFSLIVRRRFVRSKTIERPKHPWSDLE